MYEEVLVAVDGSDLASTAASQGIAVADVMGATVHVLTVVKRDDEPGSDADELVESVAADARRAGRPVETAVRTGRPSRQILEYAAESGVDLVVLGTHGRTGIRKLVLGSVALEVLRDAETPVLTVGAGATGIPRSFDDVVIATDGQPGATAAVERGLALAELYDARVHAVSVVDDTQRHLSVILEEFGENARRAVGDVESRAAHRGLAVTREVLRGHPAEAIVDYAEDADADLIVLGTESRSSLERVVIGSVSQRVVRAASTPVLAVRTVAE